jgi:DNA-binding NtrC family response regulator
MSLNNINHIFVVDDEHAIAYSLAAILHMNGYTAQFFTSPVLALAAARSDRPDMLMSDVAMPEQSGVDLAIAMSVQFPGLAILLFSGQAKTHDLLETARMRGYEFKLLPKPLHPASLLSYIRSLAPPQSSSDVK